MWRHGDMTHFGSAKWYRVPGLAHPRVPVLTAHVPEVGVRRHANDLNSAAARADYVDLPVNIQDRANYAGLLIVETAKYTVFWALIGLNPGPKTLPTGHPGGHCEGHGRGVPGSLPQSLGPGLPARVSAGVLPGLLPAHDPGVLPGLPVPVPAGLRPGLPAGLPPGLPRGHSRVDSGVDSPTDSPGDSLRDSQCGT